MGISEKPDIEGLRIDRRDKARSGAGGVLAWGLVLLLLGAGVAWWIWGRPKGVEVETVAVRPVALERASAARTLLNASGYVTPRREATVSSKVTGKVVEVMIEEGMRVESGQVLARLDASNVEASFKLAEAQWAASRAQLAETEVRLADARKEWRRVKELSQRNIASEAELDRAHAESQSLAARLEKQKADAEVVEREVAVWKQHLEDTVIRAPFAGIVTSKNAQPGEMISPVSAGGGFTRTGICTLVDMGSLEIEVDVNESYINRVRPGQPVEATLDSYQDWKIPSKVIAIIPTADRQKATVRVRVAFEQLDPRILPQMGVKVAFRENVADVAPASTPLAGRSLMAIPRGAVRSEGGREVVWVTRAGKAERRAVQVERTEGDTVMVQAGLNAGEQVVVSGAEKLQDGGAVREKSK